MKLLLLLASMVTSSWATIAIAEKIEIDIHGMTCAFCVDSLQRNLGKLPDVKSVAVSLKLKKIHIETKSENADIKRIKQTILDTGFTPVKITSVPDVQ